MAGPAISVVIATYNRSRALAYAIESVLSQTFADWELIVVGEEMVQSYESLLARYAAQAAQV